MNTMLTSSNQYLRPEYLTPLPTTLDAKKSPLALLAQTCSAIGADSPNPKPISAAEKASRKPSPRAADARSARDKASPAPSVGEAPAKASFKPYESCLPGRDKTRSPDDRKARTPATVGAAAGSRPRCASNLSSSSRGASPRRREPEEASPPPRRSPSRSEPRRSPAVEAGRVSTPASSGGELAPTSHRLHAPKEAPSPLGAFKPSPAFAGFPLPAELLAAQHARYLGYARAGAGKGAAEACRDPYCAGCSLGAQLLGLKGGCPAGCAQCEHGKGYSAGGLAHAQLAALAAAQLPYVCSWVAADAAYCGKRFAGSDELLQHLRGHAAALAGYAAPALSPLAPRFHPYGKPPPPPPPHPSLVPAPLPYGLPPHPSLAAYFPPYHPLFGPRGLHP